MEKTKKIEFDAPGFIKRLKSMLLVDFYRLFHTPLFYIFLAIAAIIPAMIIGTTGVDGSQTGALFTNTWEAIAVSKPLYVIENIGQYANMNMVFIFGGIMVSIFIGHDYKSGYVKQLFTTHAKKQDYMMSKSAVCAFAMASMCLTYLIGTILAGAFVGLSFKVNFGSLFCALIGKLIMSIGWASLYVFINIIFRKHFWISIMMSFFFGTGILIIGIASILGNSAILNVFLYGSSVYACLSSNFLSILICLVVSVLWAFIYNLIGTLILNKSDVY